MVSDLTVLATMFGPGWLPKLDYSFCIGIRVFYPRTIYLPLSKLMPGAVGLKLKLKNSRNRKLLSEAKTPNQTQKLV